MSTTTFLPIGDAALLARINAAYGLYHESIRLHRTSGGRVYYLYGPGGRTVFKLYRPLHTEQAIQSTHVLSYLRACGYPVVTVIPTAQGALHLTLEGAQCECVGILFDYAPGRDIGFLHRWRSGKHPLVHPKTKLLGRQIGRLHRLMEGYEGPLIAKGKAQYINALTGWLARHSYDEARVQDFQDYGDALWAMLELLPQGFCHGDAHTGNTAYRGGVFTLMDFDRVSRSFPILDVAWLCDGTDFNRFDEGGLERSMELFDAFYAGYGQERILTDGEIKAVFHGIAVIHYDLISSIALADGQVPNPALIEEQHDWLMRWRGLCDRVK